MESGRLGNHQVQVASLLPLLDVVLLCSWNWGACKIHVRFWYNAQDGREIFIKQDTKYTGA